MSLNVIITKPTSVTDAGSPYSLLAETVSHSFSRFPAQAGLPKTTANPSYNPVLLLDLGICIEQISIEGIVNTTALNAGDPTKAQLESVMRGWFIATSVTPNQMTKLTINSTQSYYGAFKSATFSQQAAQEDRWSFSLIFLVSSTA
jgi:hypothetical protein